VEAVARAEPGGVVFHCAGGRDRAGQIAMLLAPVDVAPEDIAADYALSAERLRARGEEDEGALLDAFLRARAPRLAK
jgi:protein-tyrosine phosphatase